MVDPRAARAWSEGAELYELGRPGFPPEAVAIALRGLGLEPGARVLDLAAGTGKLTRALVAARLSVVAVEPLAAMRAVFVEACPDVSVLAGTAEAIPLGDGSVDAVFVGQAVHWFDVPAACREIGRVLRPDGGVALLRNDWVDGDERSPWVGELREVLGSRVPGCEPSHAPYGGGRWQPAVEASGVFGVLQQATVEHQERRDVEGVLTQMASWSFLTVSDDMRPALLQDAERVLAAHRPRRAGEGLTVRYATDVRWARRAASTA